ncbi:uncharacterized protein CBL_06294 [Carabus blaptoides fortunei]
MMTPLDDFAYLINHVLLGEEPTVEDFILLVGTLVAFVAFILWCCFPVVPKDTQGPPHYESREYNRGYSQRKTEHCTT